MDLDDSFTENLMQRTKARREYINSKKYESSTVMGKKRSAVHDEYQVTNENGALDDPEESPKRQCLEVAQKDSLISGQEKENIKDSSFSAFVPYSTSKPRGLAALKKSHDTDGDFNEDAKRQCLKSVDNNASSYGRKINKLDDKDSPFGPFHSASKVRGLAALKKQFSDNHDKIQEETSNEETGNSQVNNVNTYVFSTSSKELCTSQKSTLHGLATNAEQLEKVSKRTAFPNIAHNVPYSPNAETESSPKCSSASITLSYTNKKACSNSSDVENLKAAEYSKHANKIGVCQDVSCLPLLEKSNVRSDNNVNIRQNKDLKTWDQAIAATLESEGCVSTQVKLRKCAKEQLGLEETPVQLQDSKDGEVKSSMKGVSVDQDVDPAELPLSARKALFEKALLQGTPKKNENAGDASLSVAQRAALFENASKSKQALKPKLQVPQRALAPVSPVKSLTSNTKSIEKIEVSSEINKANQTPQNVEQGSPFKKPAINPVHSTPSPSKNVGSHTRQVQQKLIENTNVWQKRDIISKTSDERKREISSLVNHWEKLSSSSSLEKSNSEEEQPEENFEDEHSLESEVNSDENISVCNSSNCSNQDNVHESNLNSRVSPSSSQLEDSRKEDELSYSDCENEEQISCDPEANSVGDTSSNVSLKHNFASSSSYSTPFDHSRTLSSSSDDSSKYVSTYNSCSSAGSVGSYEAMVSNQSEDTPANEINHETPLMHTVSFYRKQKQETRTPPLRTIVRNEQVKSPLSADDNQGEIIQERIQALQEEILRQQTVISQTSQALNLCIATAEFSGSTEQIEGERLLLIATQKRQACLNEIQRLKTHGAQRENVSDGTGTLTITGIQLPLKREFIGGQVEGKTNDMVHYFLCLIRFGAQVIVTQMVSTSDKIFDGALCFTNHIKLQNLPADFSVVFEVYGLQAKKEVLPHEKKYHIKREYSKIRLTPKGKRADGKILLPAVSSPGGPTAVRSSSFGVIGYTRFNLQNCNKNCFTLDKVPFTSPLEGILKVKLSLHAEHKIMEKGFVTMFEDVSGFGAWHRRWCSLDAQYLSYWKYPDDEQKKDPIGTLDLKQCITGQVKLVPRDVCARPHTFQLVVVRPQEKGDKNTLISRSVNTLTTTKHLLSADTKEERVVWCHKLNEALTNVRKWNPEALRPVDLKQDS